MSLSAQMHVKLNMKADFLLTIKRQNENSFCLWKITSDSCRGQRKLVANAGSWDAVARSCSWQHMSNQIPDSPDNRVAWRNVVGLLSVMKQFQCEASVVR